MKRNSVISSSQDDAIKKIPACLKDAVTIATSTSSDETVSVNDPIEVETSKKDSTIINIYNTQLIGFFQYSQQPTTQNKAVNACQSQTTMQGTPSQNTYGCPPQYMCGYPPPVMYSTLIYAGEFTPRALYRILPQGGEVKRIDFCPSSILEDFENTTNILKASIADIIIAKEVLSGNSLEYFPMPVSENWWNDPYSQYPFLQQYCWAHSFPNLVAGAEKVLYGKGLHKANVWDIQLDSILKNDYWWQHFQKCEYPAPAYTSNISIYHLPGEQGGCLEQFSSVISWYGNYGMTLPIRGIKPKLPIMNQTVSRFFALPLDNYPLFGLDRLHHGGKKLVFLTPSMREALMNIGNPDASVVSWIGGPYTIEKVDIEPLRGFTVVYVFNPNTFSTSQEAIDCFKMVKKKFDEKEIGLKMAIAEENPNLVKDIPSPSERMLEAQKVTFPCRYDAPRNYGSIFEENDEQQSYRTYQL